jgi:hypothetical protein
MSNVMPDGSFEEPGGGGGGGVVTVIDAPLLVLPSLSAVIVAVPLAIAVTRPDVGLTEATPGFPLDQAMTRPARTLLLASRVTAES